MHTLQYKNMIQCQCHEMLPMGMPRYGAVASVIAGQLLVCGRRDHDSDYLNSGEQCNPLATLWSEAPPMRKRRVGAVAGVVAGEVIVCGGIGVMVQLL